MRFRPLLILLVPCLAVTALPVGAVDREVDGFERDVAPILVMSCVGCHNHTEPSGGLDLTTIAALRKGGDSGAAVVPGDPEASYLIERVKNGEMPPPDQASPLTEAQLATLRAWIDAGAPWPKGRVLSEFDVTAAKRAGRDWWALAPPERASPPSVKHTEWVRHPIAAFVARKLEAEGLSPSPDAGRATLLRRLKLGLLGLPPTPEELRAFVDDPDPRAYCLLYTSPSPRA